MFCCCHWPIVLLLPNKEMRRQWIQTTVIIDCNNSGKSTPDALPEPPVGVGWRNPNGRLQVYFKMSWHHSADQLDVITSFLFPKVFQCQACPFLLNALNTDILGSFHWGCCTNLNSHVREEVIIQTWVELDASSLFICTFQLSTSSLLAHVLKLHTSNYANIKLVSPTLASQFTWVLNMNTFTIYGAIGLHSLCMTQAHGWVTFTMCLIKAGIIITISRPSSYMHEQ